MAGISGDQPGPGEGRKAEFFRLLKAKSDQYDYLSRTPHLHMAFIFKTVIDNLQDIPNLLQKTIKRLQRIYSFKFKTPKHPDLLVISGSVAEGISVPESMERQVGSKYTKVSPDIDIMVVHPGLYVDNKSRTFGLNLIFDPSGSHHGYTRLKVISHFTDSQFEVEKFGNDTYLTSEGFLQACDLEMLPEELGRQELGVKAETSTTRQGPAVTSEGSMVMCENNLGNQTMVDTVAAIKTTWPDVAKAWFQRKPHGTWPSAELMQCLEAEGCHVVPVSHAHSAHPSLEFRLSFSRAEVLLVHSLTQFQRSCYRLFKIICSAGISPNKVIATYFLKTTFFWVRHQTPDHFWQQSNVSYIFLALLDKLLCFLAKRFLPNYFGPENNMIDHILPEKLKMAEKSLVRIRNDPVKYLFMFSRSRLFRRGGFPWHKAFIPVVNNIPKYTQMKQIDGSTEAFQKSLDICAHFQVDGYCFAEALSNYNALIDIKELTTNNLQIAYRLKYASDSCMLLLQDRDEGWLFTTVNKLIAFHRRMFVNALIAPDETAVLHSRIGLLYLVLSQLPNPKYASRLTMALEMVKELERDMYEKEFMTHRVEHLNKAKESLEKSIDFWKGSRENQHPFYVSLRLAQVLLLQGKPREAEDYLNTVTQNPNSQNDTIGIMSCEEHLHEVDFLVKFILEASRECTEGNKPGRKQVSLEEHVKCCYQTEAPGDDSATSQERNQILLQPSEGVLPFSQILRKQFITHVPCDVFAQYLLILSQLLQGQRSARLDLLELKELCQSEEDLASAHGKTGSAGKIKVVSMSLYRDCCTIVKNTIK